MEKVYYVYLDPESNLYYYFDTQSQQTSYDKPENGRLLDPVTGKKFRFKKSEKDSDSLSEKNHNSNSRRSKQRTSLKLVAQTPQFELTKQNKSKQSSSINSNAILEPVDSKHGRLDSKRKKRKQETKDDNTSENKDDHSSDCLPDTNYEIQPPASKRPRSTTTKTPIKPPQPSVAPLETDNDPQTSLLDIPVSVTTFNPNIDPTIQRDKSFVPGEDGNMPSLPDDLQKDIHKFKIEDYAHQYFRTRRSKTIFGRKQVSVEDLITYSAEPISKPLLLTLSEKDSKLAIQMFNHILKYTGAITSANPSVCADKIVSALNDNPILRDEVYFQLIKQTRTNDRLDVLVKTWQLFLIVATLFPSTQNSQMWILNHLSINCKSEIPEVASLAQFTYIRFSARCAHGEPLQYNEIGFLQKIPNHHVTSQQKFGSSIYEQLWQQQSTCPQFPVPMFLFIVSEELKKKNFQEQQGIFRIGGNVKLVSSVAAQIDKGESVDYESLHVNDVSSLMKKWVRDLPDPIIPVSRTQDILTAAEDKNFLGFADSFPHAHRSVLKYLVGFLRIVSENSEVNKMPIYNVSVCFGPNMIKTSNTIDAQQASVLSDLSTNFLLRLINDWDVSEVYPIDPTLIPQ